MVGQNRLLIVIFVVWDATGGEDKSSHKPVHIELVELKKQIDWFIEKRNIHTLSIAGGEPLLYPSILELVKYAS